MICRNCCTENLTVGQLLDVWAEEELKTGTLSNGTVENYLGTIRNIKKHPLAERKLKNVTSEHLQSFFDLLSFGGVHPDGKERKGYSKDYIHSFSAVMQQSFRFAVFPKQYITSVSYTHLDVYKRQADREMTAYLIQVEGTDAWNKIEIQIVDTDSHYGAAAIFNPCV